MAVGRTNGFSVGLDVIVGERGATRVGLAVILIGVCVYSGLINPAVVSARDSFALQAITPGARSSPSSRKIQYFNPLRPLLPQNAYLLEKVWLSLSLPPL